MGVSVKAAAAILLGVNLMLLFGFGLTLMSILLDNSVAQYDWLYNATYEIQPIIVYAWFLSIGFSPVLAVVFSFWLGYEIRKTIQWKYSLAIMVFAGIPSLAFVGLGLAMVYLL